VKHPGNPPGFFILFATAITVRCLPEDNFYRLGMATEGITGCPFTQ